MIAKEILQYDESLVSSIMSGHRWVCFGAGRCFREFIKKYCVQRKMLPLPECCFDSNQDLWGQEISNVRIESPDLLTTHKYDDAMIVVCSVLPYSIISYLNTFVYGGGMAAWSLLQIEMYLYYKENTESFEKVYALIQDDVSRYTFRSYLSEVMAGHIYYPKLFSPYPYWGNDVIKHLSAGESIVYAGVAKGESLDRALQLNRGVRIHGFEPNAYQYEELKKKYKNMNNISLYNYGLSDEEGESKFIDTQGYSSRMVNDDDNVQVNSKDMLSKIMLQTVDNVVEGNIDLIAFDIEGAEVRALYGCEKSIKQYHPRLAISVYHKVEHYLEIPLLINAFSNDYKLYFRHHSMAPAESVIYAI